MIRFIFFIIIILSTHKVESQSDCGVSVLEGSEMFVSAKCNSDSIFYVYKNCRITTFPKKDFAGEDIRIEDSLKQVRFLKMNESQHFYGIFNNKMIIDVGTSSCATLKIYDINNLNLLFEDSYHSYSIIKNNCIYYNYILTPKDKFIKPKCPKTKTFDEYPDYIGYTEERFYNLKTLKLTKTGIIKCEYFE